MNTTLYRGSCLCGDVKFAISGSPNWVAHCHCTRCQLAHGSAFVTWVGASEDAVSIDDPANSLSWYEARTGARRGFCGHCGSPMFFRSERYPGETHVARALITEPLDLVPQSHAFYDSHVPWVTIAEHLPVDIDPP